MINVKKLREEAKLPTYGSAGAACFDLYCIAGGVVRNGSPIAFGTGLAIEIPEGHVMMLYSRSGHGFTHSVRLANCTGIIDSDYRGELAVKLTCDSNLASFTVEAGDRIAQAMIIPVSRCYFQQVEELASTVRGSGGFGSTGK